MAAENDDDTIPMAPLLKAEPASENAAFDQDWEEKDQEKAWLSGEDPSSQRKVHDNEDHLQRRLGNRQIQLIAIGGSIGTALFVSIGTGLYQGGAGSMLIAYTIQTCVVSMVNNSIAEMSVAYPVSGGFIRLAGKWVDDALGFMVGWNFFFYEALLIPFEISAFNLVLAFWGDFFEKPLVVAGVCLVVILCYAAVNVLAVKAYGEAEFWLSGGKVILIFSLFFFTAITMVGGNPKHDAYGFRHWQDGAFREYLATGALGRFEGFLAAIWSAAFTIVGPEYISIVAAEAKRPRIYIKSAFKTVYARFAIFFIGSALAVGIVCSSRDPRLAQVVNSDDSDTVESAAASPYVIAMENLGVSVFPHIVNALMLTSIFSAGNTYTYCAVRNLYGLALEGRAPSMLTHCTKSGVPIYCLFATLVFPALSFFSVTHGSSIVITWFARLVTAGGLIDYMVMSLTYIFFYRACKAQGLNRVTLPYIGWLQPFCAYFALIWLFAIACAYGYPALRPWSAKGFFSHYTMQILMPVLYIGWKIVKKTKVVRPREADLVWERPTIDAYEATFTEAPTGFWGEIVSMLRLFNISRGYQRLS